MNKSKSKKISLWFWFNRWFSNLWVAKGVALVASLNLLLVLFDVSYIPFRDFWLQGRIQLFIKIGPIERNFPDPPLKFPTFNITKGYDWVKGIEPYRDTVQYLNTVEKLNNTINEFALDSQENKTQSQIETQQKQIDAILADLRQQSIDMIETNPFQIANKTGTLERIKNKMREQVFGIEEASAKESFRIFWSRDYLNKNDLRSQLNFFDSEIKPLIETNYFRPVGENGEPVNNFGLIDFPFFVIFLVDFLGRTLYISRRYTGVNWRDAMLWRWYDIFLLIPVFRWLRVIPVTIRLNQAKLIDLRAIQKQASQGFVASIAEDLTEVVVIRIINQVQDSVSRGEISKMLEQTNVKPYIDINDTNETVEIVRLMMQLVVYQVMPKVRTNVEELLQYNIEKILGQSPGFNGIQQLPGMKTLQHNLTEQIVRQTYNVVSDALEGLLEEDPVFDELIERLVENASKSINSEVQAQQNIEQIESLLTDLLEEVKINYIQRLSEEDVEAILEQTRAIRQGQKTHA